MSPYILTVAAPFRAFALPSAGLAVALTTSHALVWDYTAANGPARPISLPLPFTTKPSEPLPLGAIVRSGATTEFGVLAVSAVRGKLVFWENVDSAQVRAHFAQKPQGIEGSLKMYSGETITELVDIEHAGYIVVFSSGRSAQLTLRDAQGRPSITSTPMNSPSSSGGSFFSFKGLLGSGFRKTIASVRAHQSASKGQMEVITATRNGVFQTWDLSWSGQQMFKGEVDIRNDILSTIQTGASLESRSQHDAHVLDFAIMEKQKDRGLVSLLVLVALSEYNSTSFTLLMMDLSQNTAVVRRVIPIKNFHQSRVPQEPEGKLVLPASGNTAFVQFPGAVVVASLAQPGESPDVQLLSDSGKPSLPYQDTVYLRDDMRCQFCGCAADRPSKKDRRSSAIFFIQGYGMIQVACLPNTDNEEDLERLTVTAKSKLEQATFFSVLPDNILDFSIKDRYTFSSKAVETAALEISSAILSSSYDHIDQVAASMDEHLGQRASALHALITHLQTDYPPLSPSGRWQLLWHAEKLAAARALWKAYEEKFQDKQVRPEAYPQGLILPSMVTAVHEKFKTLVRPELGEADPVRHFFIKDVGVMETLIPHAWHTVRHFWQRHQKDREAVLHKINQADDAFRTGLETAFQFRMENAELYGFNAAVFEDGVLLPRHGQDLLPEFWTSTHNMVTSLRSLVDVGRNLAFANYREAAQEDVSMKVAKDNTYLVKLECKVHIERSTWGLAQSDVKLHEMGKKLQEDWQTNVRPQHLTGLAEVGQAEEAMSLAEFYKDMPTLAGLVWNEIGFIEEAKADALTKMRQAECHVKMDKMKERIHRYFEEFDASWATAFYTKWIEARQAERIFWKDYMDQTALTRFLRSSTAFGKLAWINEVIGEQNYEAAHDELVDVAANRETNAWCKKVELSIAKLSLLSTKEKGRKLDEAAAEEIESKLEQTQARLTYAKIQDLLYERLAPTISEALDDESAVQLLMAQFGSGPLDNRSAHQHLLKQGFEALVQHRILDTPLLVDVLTLMRYEDINNRTDDIMKDNEFAFALNAVLLSWNDLTKAAREGLLDLIWKRACLRDDWKTITITKSAKDMSDAQLQDFLVSETTVGWTLKTLLSMICKYSARFV